MLRVKAPTAQGRLTLCCFCIWNSSASGHATAPTRKNDSDYRPSSVCPSGSHLPPGEGIPQMGRYTFTLSNRTPPPTPSVTPPPTRREAYALPLLHMEFERIGACHRPYTQKRSCLPPLIRLPFGQPPSPRGRHPSDESVHFYVVQPYPLRATQAWPTSPCTPGGSASQKASPEFVRIGACRRPYRICRGCLRNRLFPHSLYIDHRLLRKISGKGKNSG